MTEATRSTTPRTDAAGSMRIGVDLGGTKIEAIAIDGAGCERYRRRVPTPHGDYDATLEAIASLVADAEASLGARASVGMGTPGSISRATGHLRGANSVCLNGRPIREDLARRLGREVRVTNDANCFALSEAADGAGAGADVVFGVILGTGVGGGIVVRGRVLDGPNGIAGEWGHNRLPLLAGEPRAARTCWCGRPDCVEAWLSGPALAADHALAGGGALNAEQVVAAMRAGDAVAAASFERYARRLALALAGIVNVLDPQVIVLGGGLSQVPELFERVPALWGPHVFSDRIGTALRPARHGDSSGVRGAAWLAGASD